MTMTLAIGSVVACTFVPRTLSEAAELSSYIYVARVVDNPADRTYVLDVQEVFRGDVPATLTFAPDPGEPVSSCEAAPHVGSTYLFGNQDLDGVLGQGEVWLRIKGDEFVAVSIVAPDGGTADLYETLRELPDTALPAPPSPRTAPAPGTVMMGVALLIAAIATAIARHRSAAAAGEREKTV
jgi:hypothetical protein